MKDAAFYCYAAPEPQGFARQKVRPEAAMYQTQLGEFVLLQEDARRGGAPTATVFDFLQSTYEAGANLAKWDRKALERFAGTCRWRGLRRTLGLKLFSYEADQIYADGRRCCEECVKMGDNGSICGCAWSADTLAAVIRPRTSTRPSIFIAPSIRSYAPLSPAKHGYGVTWTSFRLGRLQTSILRVINLLPRIHCPKIYYRKSTTHLTTLIPMRLMPIQKLLPTICFLFFLCHFLRWHFQRRWRWHSQRSGPAAKANA